VENFRDFLKALPYTHKVIIGGNHDITLHEDYYEEMGEERFHKVCVCVCVLYVYVCVCVCLQIRKVTEGKERDTLKVKVTFTHTHTYTYTHIHTHIHTHRDAPTDPTSLLK
jgi:hypothetical protein